MLERKLQRLIRCRNRIQNFYIKADSAYSSYVHTNKYVDGMSGLELIQLELELKDIIKNVLIQLIDNNFEFRDVLTPEPGAILEQSLLDKPIYRYFSDVCILFVEIINTDPINDTEGVRPKTRSLLFRLKMLQDELDFEIAECILNGGK